jgi:hypothetical protein
VQFETVFAERCDQIVMREERCVKKVFREEVSVSKALGRKIWPMCPNQQGTT